MPITINYGGPVGALAAGAFAGGRGRYRKYLEEVARQEEELAQRERMQIRGLDYGRQQFLDGVAADAIARQEQIAANAASQFRSFAFNNAGAIRDQGFRQQNAFTDFAMDRERALLGGQIQGALAQQQNAAADARQQAGFDQQGAMFDAEAAFRMDLLDRTAEIAKQREQEQYTEGQRRFAEQIRNNYAAIEQAAAGENPILSEAEAEAARRAVAMQAANISKLPSPIPKQSPTVEDATNERVIPVGDDVPGAYWVMQPDGKLDLKEIKPAAPEKPAEPSVKFGDFQKSYQEAYQAVWDSKSKGDEPADPPSQDEVLAYMKNLQSAYQQMYPTPPAGGQQQQGGGQTVGGPQQVPQPAAGAPVQAAPGDMPPEQAQAIVADPARADFAAAPPGPAVPFQAAYANVSAELSRPEAYLSVSGFKENDFRPGDNLPSFPEATIEAYAYLETFGATPKGEAMKEFVRAMPPAQQAHYIAALKTAAMSGLEGMPRPQTPQEAALIPPGVEYFAPDGSIRVKQIRGGQ